MRFFSRMMCYAGLVLILIYQGCTPTSVDFIEEANPTTITLEIPGLTAPEVSALESLTRVNNYPVYVMHTDVDYRTSRTTLSFHSIKKKQDKPWACSLFAALGDKRNILYGRNFDWEYSPALLLFSHPPDGYASVSMVNLSFLMPEEKINQLTEISLDQRVELLAAHLWPIDGMNEYGLVVGMAAVPYSQVPIQQGHDWIGSLGIIREMLDRARDVQEAIEIVKQYNIRFDGGPQIHYLVADASGQAVLIELYEGELYLHPNKGQWHAATNFTFAAVEGSSIGHCRRYDTLVRQLEKSEGRITKDDAIYLLSEVAQQMTQWSVVYEATSRTISIAMGRNYSNVQTFSLTD